MRQLGTLPRVILCILGLLVLGILIAGCAQAGAPGAAEHQSFQRYTIHRVDQIDVNRTVYAIRDNLSAAPGQLPKCYVVLEVRYSSYNGHTGLAPTLLGETACESVQSVEKVK